MRSTIFHILLVALAWCIAFSIVRTQDWSGLSRRPLDKKTYSEIAVYCSAELEGFEPEIPLTDDAWGNPYTFVPREELTSEIEIPTRAEQKTHVFSMGADGVSESAGNDPDDINSWNSNSMKLYERRWQKEVLDREAMVPSIIVTPFIYLAGLVLFRLCALLVPAR